MTVMKKYFFQLDTSTKRQKTFVFYLKEFNFCILYFPNEEVDNQLPCRFFTYNNERTTDFANKIHPSMCTEVAFLVQLLNKIFYTTWLGSQQSHYP